MKYVQLVMKMVANAFVREIVRDAWIWLKRERFPADWAGWLKSPDCDLVQA